MYKRSLMTFAALAVICGCGPGTNPGDREDILEVLNRTPQETAGEIIKAYAPFYASGQNGEDMGTASCSTLAGRPCIQARASSGMPFHFDSNTHIGGEEIGTAPVNPHTTAAGAGKTKVDAGPRAPDLPRAENRDLHILGKQPTAGEQVF